MSAFVHQWWLERFEASGGGWIVQDGIAVLLCPTGATACEGCLAELEASGRRTDVLDLILHRHAAKEPACRSRRTEN